jgi:hypothetical protein
MSSFLLDVAKLDMTRYSLSLKVGSITDLGGLPKEEGLYSLQCNGSQIDVIYTIVNGTISYFNLQTLNGTALFVEQPSANLIERTEAFLQNYQKYSGDSAFQLFRNMLSTVDEVKDTTITLDNVRFEITKFSSSTRFRWVNTFNGADYSSFGISFKVNSTDFAFSDDRYKKNGGTEIKISKEQAISIARERAKNISWKVNISDTSIIEVSNVTILDDHVGVELLTSNREPLVMYPYWQVSLTFDKIYPGSVYGVSYSIWADTGEVFYGNLQMIGGSVSDESTFSSSNTSTQSPQASQHSSVVELTFPPVLNEMPENTVPLQQPTDTSTPEKTDNTFTTAAAVVSIVAILLITMLFKRKRSNKSSFFESAGRSFRLVYL